MSLNQLIELTRRSFLANQAVINTVGQNIANENTEGYSRQRVRLRPESIHSPGILIPTPHNTATGVGVGVQDIDRIRDQLVTQALWEAQAGYGSADEESRILGTLENLLPINTEGSLQSVLTNFWNGWGDLADNPTDEGARIALWARANSLVGTINRTVTDVRRLEDDTVIALEQAVAEFNKKLDDIAAINTQIMAARSQGIPDLASEDQRDLLVKELGEFAPIHVEIAEFNEYTISVNGMTVLHRDQSQPLVLDTLASPPTLTFQGTSIAYQPPQGDDGRLGSLMRTLSTTLPGVIQDLDDFAATLVDRVNTIHSAGFGMDGITGRNFFDPAGLTADTLALSADIANPVNIAASGDPNARGDNATAMALVTERTAQQAALNNATFEESMITLVTSVGNGLERANAQYEGHNAIVQYLDALERGASGVSLDEELTLLINYQRSFGAAAQVLSTATQMYDTILNL